MWGRLAAANVCASSLFERTAVVCVCFLLFGHPQVCELTGFASFCDTTAAAGLTAVIVAGARAGTDICLVCNCLLGVSVTLPLSCPVFFCLLSQLCLYYLFPHSLLSLQLFSSPLCSLLPQSVACNAFAARCNAFVWATSLS